MIWIFLVVAVIAFITLGALSVWVTVLSMSLKFMLGLFITVVMFS